MPEDRHDNWLRGILPLLLPLISVGATVVPLLCDPDADSPGRPWLVLFLLLPTTIFCVVLALKAFASTAQHFEALGFFLACEGLKLLGVWQVYQKQGLFESWSVLAIFATAGLSLAASWYAVVVLYDGGADEASTRGVAVVRRRVAGMRSRLKAFRDSVRTLRLELLALFATFLYVTYFLTLALAFHDKDQLLHHGGDSLPRALYADSYELSGDETQASRTASVKEVPSNAREEKTEPPVPERWSEIWKSCAAKDDAMTRTLWFEESVAGLDLCVLNALQLLKGAEPSDGASPENAAGDLLSKAEGCTKGSGLDERNLESLVCLKAHLLNATAMNPYQRLQVGITGRASDKRSKDPAFPTNYELSEARALSARMALTTLIGSQAPNAHTDFFPMPRSSEPMLPGSGAPGASVRPEPSAEVTLHATPDELLQLHDRNLTRKPADLNFLDYLYFMIYTITTTGYGDMRPVTPMAKFICSVANLFEVLFLVVLFNVLVGSQRSAAGAGGAGAAGGA